MYFLQMLIIYVSVDLRSGDRGVAEQSLNCSDVCAFFDKCGCETMSEGMWSHFLADTC